MDMQSVPDFKPKSFWERPEGTTGMVFLSALLLGGGFVLYKALPYIVSLLANTLYASVLGVALFAIIYMILDPRMRALVGYMYKSIMRWITGIFVTIDPIGILKNYVSDLEGSLVKMNTQIGKLRAQMHKLNEIIVNNKKEIQANITMAGKAKEKNSDNVMILKTRKAGRLQDSNMRLEDLYKKMEVLYRVLTKMYENSGIMVEDLKDQVVVKEQERTAIRASHSAMQSAMSIISGNGDKRQMFDMALEAVADDVAGKVGEMERFMEVSNGFMNSIDLQNGVFEEEGLKMLDEWELKSKSLLLGDAKDTIILQSKNDNDVLDLNAPLKVERPVKNQYDTFFE
jgi:hypothetical protein